MTEFKMTTAVCPACGTVFAERTELEAGHAYSRHMHLYHDQVPLSPVQEEVLGG